MPEKDASYINTNNPVLNTPSDSDRECLRLEGVTTSVGFDDLLDVTLNENHQHFDTFIVVTSHEDKLTQLVARKHGATCVVTDLFKKNGRKFNKGAAINSGMDHFQYFGWRMHIDSDIVLPTSFRRMVFNHTHLDTEAIYGADRLDVVGLDALHKIIHTRNPQHAHSFLVIPPPHQIASRYVDGLRGYVPIGYLQMWHHSQQRYYPFTLGTAAHDDVMFAASWPLGKRLILPTVFVYHLTPTRTEFGANWDGRKQPRLDAKK